MRKLSLITTIASVLVAAACSSSSSETGGEPGPGAGPPGSTPSDEDGPSGPGSDGGPSAPGNDASAPPVVALWTRAKLEGAAVERVISVHGTAGSDVWALVKHADGTFTHHFDGTKWTKLAQFPQTAAAIYAVSKTEVWALGTTSGASFRWSGSAWTPKGTFGVTSAYALWASSASDVWVGSQSNLGSEKSTRRWDGSKWNMVDTGATTSVTSIWGTGPSDIWAASGGSLLHWGSSSWQSMGSAPAGKVVSAVHGVAKDTAFAVGSDGLALVWDGKDWSASTTGASADLASVFATARDEAWAGAAFGGTFLKWNGSTWTAVAKTELEDASPPRYAASIWGTGAADLWVATGTELYHRVPAATHEGCEELPNVGCAEDGKPRYVRCMAAATPAEACVKLRDYSAPTRTGWCCATP